MALAKAATGTAYKFDAASEVVQSIFTADKADFHFHVIDADGSRHVIAVHKALLATLSTVFAAMFSGNWRETTSVQLTDTSAEAFGAFLGYFYRSRIDLTEHNVGDIYYLAHKYNVTAITSACVSFIRSRLSWANVLGALNLALTFELAALTAECKATISANTRRVITCGDFAECGWRILYEILTIDKIACSEGELYAACITWAIGECKKRGIDPSDAQNRRSVLGDAYNLIRFEDIFPADKAIGAAAATPKKPPARSRRQQREQCWFTFHLSDERCCVCPRSGPSKGASCACDPFRLVFRVDRPVMLRSFGLSNSKVARQTRRNMDFFAGTIRVRKIGAAADGKMFRFRRAHEPLPSAACCLQLLDKPASIEPGHTYELSVAINPRRCDTLYMFDAKKQEIDGITFVPYRGGRNVVGSDRSVFSQLRFEYRDAK